MNWSPQTTRFLANATRIEISARGNERVHLAIRTRPGLGLLLFASLSSPPGAYLADVTAFAPDGQRANATVAVSVLPLRRVPRSAERLPVVLVNGFQVSCQAPKLQPTFGALDSKLIADGVPVVYDFDNCLEHPSRDAIEALGETFEEFLDQIRYDDGTSVPKVDVVAHSMGGLIVRAYLAGLRSNAGGFVVSAPPEIRVAKFVEIATPNFGATMANSLLSSVIGGIQAKELEPGSAFLWNLATWNQGHDDLRGVDAIAVVGNAGKWADPFARHTLTGFGDGVVALTSASLGFAKALERTRVLPYCHVGRDAGLPWHILSCSSEVAIAEAPETASIVRSFLGSGQDWSHIGISAASDRYLSERTSAFFSLRGTSAEYVTNISVSVRGDPFTSNSPGIFFNENLPATSSAVFQTFNWSRGVVPCTAPLLAGVAAAIRCKSGPLISGVTVDPSAPESSGDVSVIRITGSGFGESRTPQSALAIYPSTPVPIRSWSDSLITAYFPVGLKGLAGLVVQSGDRQTDMVNILFPLPQR